MTLGTLTDKITLDREYTKNFQIRNEAIDGTLKTHEFGERKEFDLVAYDLTKTEKETLETYKTTLTLLSFEDGYSYNVKIIGNIEYTQRKISSTTILYTAFFTVSEVVS